MQRVRIARKCPNAASGVAWAVRNPPTNVLELCFCPHADVVSIFSQVPLMGNKGHINQPDECPLAVETEVGLDHAFDFGR